MLEADNYILSLGKNGISKMQVENTSIILVAAGIQIMQTGVRRINKTNNPLSNQSHALHAKNQDILPHNVQTLVNHANLDYNIQPNTQSSVI